MKIKSGVNVLEGRSNIVPFISSKSQRSWSDLGLHSSRRTAAQYIGTGLTYLSSYMSFLAGFLLTGYHNFESVEWPSMAVLRLSYGFRPVCCRS